MAQMQVAGNLGKAAVQRFTPKGDSIVSFSIADSVYAGGERKTQWINCSLFGKQGESLLPYLKKGSSVFVSGEFFAREYESNGVQNKSLDLRVSHIQLVGGRQDSQGSQSAPPAPPQRQAATPPVMDDINDDVPF